MYKKFSLSTSSPIHVSSSFIMFTNQICIKLYLTVNLTCISLITNKIKHIFYVFIGHMCFFLIKCLFMTFAHFLTVLFILSLMIRKHSLYILDMNPFLVVCVKIFPPECKYSLYFLYGIFWKISILFLILSNQSFLSYLSLFMSCLKFLLSPKSWWMLLWAAQIPMQTWNSL